MSPVAPIGFPSRAFPPPLWLTVIFPGHPLPCFLQINPKVNEPSILESCVASEWIAASGDHPLWVLRPFGHAKVYPTSNSSEGVGCECPCAAPFRALRGASHFPAGRNPRDTPRRTIAWFSEIFRTNRSAVIFFQHSPKSRLLAKSKFSMGVPASFLSFRSRSSRTQPLITFSPSCESA